MQDYLHFILAIHDVLDLNTERLRHCFAEYCEGAYKKIFSLETHTYTLYCKIFKYNFKVFVREIIDGVISKRNLF